MSGRNIGRRVVAAGFAATAVAPVRRVRGQEALPVRIGVLTDESGPYADSGGEGSVIAARMAAADFGGSVLGRKIEILHADSQNKPDIASALARRWYDESHVDAITDLPVTPVAAAVQQLAKEKTRTVMITAAAVSEFTTKWCSPVSSHWADDTHALTTGTAKHIVQGGGKSWFFVTVDYTFGKALESAAAQVIKENGGSVIGHAYFPPGSTDFSSQLLEAQASGAQVVGCASVGDDQVNLIKQAGEFGLRRGGRQSLAGFLVYITDIHALGLAATQGFAFSSGFYWDQSEAARRFAMRFHDARRAMPTKNHAAIYAATLHFLQAIAKAATTDPIAVNQAMRAMPVDYFGRPATLRRDGRLIYDLTLYRVKSPEQSTAPWDYYSPVATVPSAEAFLPITPTCG